MKSIFDNPEIGDYIIAGQDYSPITEIRHHRPGTHDHSPIFNHMDAIEYVTARGSRWRGANEHGHHQTSDDNPVAGQPKGSRTP